MKYRFRGYFIINLFDSIKNNHPSIPTTTFLLQKETNRSTKSQKWSSPCLWLLLLLLLEKDPDRRHMWRQETCVDVDLYLKLWICFLHPYLVPAQEQTLDVKFLRTNLFRLWQFQTQIGCHDHAILVSNNLRFHKKKFVVNPSLRRCVFERFPTTKNQQHPISTSKSAHDDDGDSI